MHEGTTYKLQSVEDKVHREEVPELKSSQEESDTRIALSADYGSKHGYDFVRIKSPDSDVFFILLHFASHITSCILFDTGTGNNRRMLDVSKIARELGSRQSTALLSLHGLSGCDTTSAFKGIGKIKPIKLLQKNIKYEEILCKIGESWIVEEESLRDIEDFVCRMYGYERFQSIDEVRVHILKKKCELDGKLDPKKNIDLGNLPPCLGSLKQHLKRVNYQVKIWKLALENFPEIPTPCDHGWRFGESGLEPLWSEEAVLPAQLADLLVDTAASDTDAEDDVVLESDSSSDSDY